MALLHRFTVLILLNTGAVLLPTAHAGDTVPPTLAPVAIASNNPNGAHTAWPGDVVTVSFTAGAPIQTPTVKIAGITATVANPAGNDWTGSVTVPVGAAEAPVGFSITFSDLAGNKGTMVTATTDGSSVTIDKATQPAMILAPPDRGHLGRLATVTFRLLEAALPGSVVLRFSHGGSVSLGLAESFAAAGDHTVTFSPSDPVGTSNGAIVSGGPVADGYGSLQLRYRDAAGNAEVVHATDFFVSVDTVAPRLTYGALLLPAPLNWVRTGDQLELRFHVSEGPVSGYSLSLAGLPAVEVQRPPPYDTSFSHFATITPDSPEGMIHYSVTLRDRGGNGSAVVTKQLGPKVDNTAPALTVPQDQTVEATSSAGAAVTFAASAQDNLDPAPTVTSTPASDTVFALGETMV